MEGRAMMFTMRAMKTQPSARPLGIFGVELRVQWLEAKGNPLSPSSEPETTDFADDTDNEGIPFVRLYTDRFGEFRAEVPLHPCHPCHPWFSIPVFGLSRLAEWVETTDGAVHAGSASNKVGPEKRRLKPETTENQSTTKDQTSGKHQRNDPL